MSRSAVAFYAVAMVVFGFLSFHWFSVGDTLWGVLAGVVALYDAWRLGTASGRPGAAAAPPADPFGAAGPGSTVLRVRVTGKDRLEAIRALREAVPGLGLREGRDVVDAAMESGEAVLSRAATAEQAARLREALRAAGAGIEVV